MFESEQDNSLIRLQIGNLRRLPSINSSSEQDVQSKENKTFSASLPPDTPLSTLWSKIRSAGFEIPSKLSDINGKDWYEYSRKTVFEAFDEIKIERESSTDSKVIGLDETLINFTEKNFGTPLQLKIGEDLTTYGGSSDCLEDSRGLKITFLRTVRMPDDDKLHPLPAALGTFPLYDVGSYAKALPSKMVQDGGIFLPMWQREALWIGFSCETKMKYALRICLGRINAVSGKEMEEPHSEDDASAVVQDYVVVPDQPWLDGISVGPGVVRQFVAMPLGLGYTVEGQKTGEEKHGGLQIEVIPAFQTELRTWLRDGDVPDEQDDFSPFLSNRSAKIDEFSTPRQLGFEAGAKLRLYPSPAFKKVLCSLSDIPCRQHEPTQLYASYPTAFFQYSALSRGSHTSDRASVMIRPMAAASVSAPMMPDSPRSSSQAAYDSEPLPMKACSWALDCEAESSANNHGDGFNYCDDDSEEVRAATENLQKMGLAAGGKLMQDINKDFNAANIWNTNASRLINVHLLDPASCEAVTHIVPAPPPPDAETYAKSNMPFFVVEEKPEERLESGDFEDVKSVSAMDKAQGVSEEQSLDPTKPTKCQCGLRLCDCVVRPCKHMFCHVCIKDLDMKAGSSESSAKATHEPDWKCPICQEKVAYVAGFSAPMNLPGEESIKMRVPINVLEVRDGRPEFKSIHRSRI